jgi:phage terminase large subunit-like protein
MNLAELSKVCDPRLTLQRLEAEALKRFARNKLKTYRPYIKQAQFHAHGLTYGERLLMAGNQLGKTVAGGAEWAIHLTGRYPDWWEGKVFDKPVYFWAAGVTNESTRDNPQRVLVGPPPQPELYGTGMIPYDALKDTTKAMGTPDLLDNVVVRHGGGGDVQAGESLLWFKSYEKGREKWQGPTLHGVWFDEEPPLDIYSEGRTRTQARNIFTIITFTPLLGMSDVVSRFLTEKPDGTHVTSMTIEDAEHYTPEERKKITDGYPEHEREARSKGIPVLGSGRVFPITEESIKCKPHPIPEHWLKINGIDFGWTHPSAVAFMAWDREADKIVVYDVHREAKQSVIVHAAAIKARGAWIPVAWPHDADNETAQANGEALKKQYTEQGVNMLPERAQYEDTRGNSVEAGIQDLLTYMLTGRFKVFEHLEMWFEEFRLYHRKEGKIVKERDDLMSATRYAHIMREKGSTAPIKQKLVYPKVGIV